MPVSIVLWVLVIAAGYGIYLEFCCE